MQRNAGAGSCLTAASAFARHTGSSSLFDPLQAAVVARIKSVLARTLPTTSAILLIESRLSMNDGTRGPIYTTLQDSRVVESVGLLPHRRVTLDHERDSIESAA